MLSSEDQHGNTHALAFPDNLFWMFQPAEQRIDTGQASEGRFNPKALN